MGCGDVCIDMGYECSSNDFYCEAMRRARTPHRCEECRQTIHPGDTYEVASGKTNGFVWRAKTCASCRDIRKSLVCGSWEFGVLWDHIEFSVFPVWRTSGPWDCLAKVKTEAARALLLERYRAWLPRYQTMILCDDCADAWCHPFGDWADRQRVQQYLSTHHPGDRLEREGTWVVVPEDQPCPPCMVCASTWRSRRWEGRLVLQASRA